jgi:hypothetical protein
LEIRDKVVEEKERLILRVIKEKELIASNMIQLKKI